MIQHCFVTTIVRGHLLYCHCYERTLCIVADDQLKSEPKKLDSNINDYFMLFYIIQVQLRKGYDKSKSVRDEKGVPKIKTRFGGVPLVHMTRDPVNEGTGILGSRQQHWISGFPNESSIENPVLYK